jgi:hypothetical protein
MNDGRWSTIRAALGNWEKTVQLCVIITVPQVVLVFLWLVLRR